MVNYLDDNLFESNFKVLQMLYYNKIDLSEGINPAKINNSEECVVCHC